MKVVSDLAVENLSVGEIKTSSMHRGIDKDGNSNLYSLELADESEGTRRLMSLAPGIEKVLLKGGVLLVDELLVEYIISKFQSSKTNPGHAQIIFTTHDTELLNMESLRKDQIYFVDKNRKMGRLAVGIVL